MEKKFEQINIFDYFLVMGLDTDKKSSLSSLFDIS